MRDRISLEGVAAAAGFELAGSDAARCRLGRSALDRPDLAAIVSLPIATGGAIAAAANGDAREAVSLLGCAGLLIVFLVRALRRGTFADRDGLLLRRRLYSWRLPARHIAALELRRRSHWQAHAVLRSGKSVRLRDVEISREQDPNGEVDWEIAAMSWWLAKWRSEAAGGPAAQ